MVCDVVIIVIGLCVVVVVQELVDQYVIGGVEVVGEMVVVVQQYGLGVGVVIGEFWEVQFDVLYVFECILGDEVGDFYIVGDLQCVEVGVGELGVGGVDFYGWYGGGMG